MKISEPTFKFFEFDEKISAHRSGLDSAILKNSFKPPAEYLEISTSSSIAVSYTHLRAHETQ